MHRLSICIPTFNRANLLKSCLESIYKSIKHHQWIEICISDNSSTDNTLAVIKSFKQKLPIKFSSNDKNIGLAGNIVEVTKLASGNFIWLVGDDDYLLPNSIDLIYEMMHDPSNFDVKFFYNNAYKANSLEEVLKTRIDLQSLNLEKVLLTGVNQKLNFLDLVDYKISPDFLGGMFMSIFDSDLWRAGLSCVDQDLLLKPLIFSSLDNTFVHLKVFSCAFKSSQAFLNHTPIIIATSDDRDWAPYWYLVHTRWLIAALEEYRRHGLSFFKYIKNKNKILEKFFPYFVMILLNKKKYNLSWLDLFDMIRKNCLYPNFYLSFFYPIIYVSRKILRS